MEAKDSVALSRNVRALVVQSNSYTVQPPGSLQSFLWNLWHPIAFVPSSFFFVLRKLCSVLRYKLGYYFSVYYRKDDLKLFHGKLCLDLFNGASSRLTDVQPVADPLLHRFNAILEDPFHGFATSPADFTVSYVRIPRDVLQIYTEKDARALFRIEQRFNVKFLHGRDFERGRDPTGPNAPRGVVRITIHGPYENVFDAKNELYSWIFQQGDYQEEQILIPDHAVGNVIGKGGSRVNQIRIQSKARIDVEPRDNKRNNNRNNAQSFVKVVVSGRRPARSIAKERIQNCVDHSERMREKDKMRDAIRDVRRRIMYGGSDEDSDDDYYDYDEEPAEARCSIRIADTLPVATSLNNHTSVQQHIETTSLKVNVEQSQNISMSNFPIETNGNTINYNKIDPSVNARVKFGRNNETNTNNQDTTVKVSPIIQQMKPRSVMIAEAKAAAEQKRVNSAKVSDNGASPVAVTENGRTAIKGESGVEGVECHQWPEVPEEKTPKVVVEFESSSEEEEPSTWDPNGPSWESTYLEVDDT